MFLNDPRFKSCDRIHTIDFSLSLSLAIIHQTAYCYAVMTSKTGLKFTQCFLLVSGVLVHI